MKKWPKVKLQRVTSKVGSGATPRGGEAVYQRSGIPLIRSMNVHFDGLRRDGLVYISDAEAELLDHVIVQKDDVLFNITGASIGRVTTVPKDMAGARVNQHVCILRATEPLVPRFLAYYLSTPEQQGLINNNQVGGTRQAVTKAMLLNWDVPLPARREQNRIVELLEQADALRQKRAQADALVDRILPALFHKLFGDPATNSKNFRRAKLCSVITETAYGTSVSSNTNAQGVPVLRMNNISTNGKLNLEDFKHVELKGDELRRHMLEPGDLLFNRTNSRELVGKTGIWCGEMPAVAASHLIRVRVDRAQVKPEYVWAWLNTPFTKSQLFEMARRAVGMANISATELRSLPILLPPEPPQRKFVDCHKQIHADSQRRIAGRESVESLFKTMLHRAFTGELTAKWREAHLKELLAEMEQQAKALNLPAPEKN